ncbi:glycosyl hydrolase [uncultured Phenylobacterium sp.]|uniref:glycosyl hydrolase n=1 Tax=uncultured Phenylobacterium sp. TaxID=349273 RepID=UPI0025FCF253|nr:glycosyl hydrolase [uncultured Phenylobacterium sp.]
MKLGVQTHFSQGWSTTLLDRAKALGVTGIRDSQPWSAVEKTPDTYSFPTAYTDYMSKAAVLEVGTLLTFASTNTLFDRGLTPYTAAGRQAYADYIVAVLDKYGSRVEEVEIWNEFNGDNFVTGPAAADKATAYTELLKVVYTTVKAAHPEVVVLGGAAHSVATGYLEDLFERGALDYMDAVAIHPYRSTPEHVDDELRHLTETMARYGAPKPIYATEFGNQFSDAAAAPDYLVKMVTMMSSAHVAESYWYALQDQKWFSNMGLLDTSGAAKPAAAAFAYVQKALLPLGDAVQVDVGDDRTLVYRFGEDTYVMWGASRPITISGDVVARDSSGKVIATPTALGMSPVILSGEFKFSLGESRVVADSMLEFGEGAWGYFAKTADGALHELGQVDNDWTSYIGSEWYKPLRINADSLSPAGSGANPIQAVSRYTATAAGRTEVTGAWKVGSAGDGVDLHVLLNGKEIFSRIVTAEFKLSGLLVDLRPGDVLDFAVGPNQSVLGDATGYAIQILKSDSAGPAFRGDAAVTGTAGDDALVGTGANEVLKGGTGLNAIEGGGGVDTVSYADAKTGVQVDLSRLDFQTVNRFATDKLSNIENVTGSAHADTLTGDARPNVLNGGDGVDLLLGGLGADTLIGGGGGDTLTGGADGDRFVFSFISDSKGSGASRDVITDFRGAEGDRVDLSAIDALTNVAGDQAFRLVPYYTRHAGEVMFTVEGGSWVVKGDINGDGASDFMIKFGSPVSLTAADFIF